MFQIQKKRVLAASVAVLLGLGAFAAGAAAQALDRSTVEDRVIRASNEWAAALERGDVDAVDSLLADEFVTIQQTPAGVAFLEKAVQMEMLRKNVADRPALKRTLARTRVRMFGEVAILTAVANFEVTRTNGTRDSSQAIIAETWVNERGRWRLAHFQPTVVPPRAATSAGGR